MKLTKLLLLCFLLFSIYSCSDDNDDPIPKPNSEAEEQINKVIDVLDGDKELSTFKAALANIDAKKFTDKKFTILAYKNQNKPKTRSSESDSIEQQTMRHIIGGYHTFETLSKLEKVVALSKDTLYIDYSELNKSIFINGVQLGKSVTADKSIVFVVDSIIPQVQETIETGKEFEFKVMNINSNWRPEDLSTSGIVENARITIYEDDKIIKELKTDVNGIARFIYNANADLDYVVQTDTSSMFYQNYLVTGLFTTQDEIDAAPEQKEFKAVLGGLRFADANGDGVIDSDDTMDREKLSSLPEDKIVYLVGKSYTFPKEEIDEPVSWEMVEFAYNQSSEFFYSIDNEYSSLSKRQGLSPESNIVDTLWNRSYDLIIKVNKRLAEEVAGEKEQLLVYRSEAYINLATAFGGVPLQLESSLNFNLSRNTQGEVLSLAIQDLDQVFALSADSTKYKSEEYVKSLHALRLQKNYNKAYEKSREAIHSGTVQLSVDSGATTLPISHIYLVAAESANELGNITEATQYMNQLLNADKMPPLAGNSKAEIAAAIRDYYNGRDADLKYINIQSWRLNSSWSEKYKLLPIPNSAIREYNGNITQNTGY